MTATSEPAIKANSTEAQRLYQRGLAAARGGQKRVAAVLLTRSLQLDPHNEMGWLWLSGVLDDPSQQAFCLNAVLKLNPANQHAQRGLRVLEERQLLTGAPAAAPGLSMPSAPAPAAAPADAERHESWWVTWRRSRRESSRFRLLLWAFPIALVCLSLVLYESFAIALERAAAPAPVAEVAYSAAITAPTAPARATVESILEAEPLAVVESLSAGYISAMDPIRAELRSATEAYRKATTQPGGSVGHVAATQRLLGTVDAALAQMEGLRPPATLEPAHQDYLRGLELQREGLDALLEFYSSYDVANANRAALRFQQARAYVERAQAAFVGQARQLAELSAVSSQTAR